MIALALAALLYAAPSPNWTPGPDDPVCEPGQSVQVDHCAQGQLPGETTGRETTPAPTNPPADPTAVVLPAAPVAQEPTAPVVGRPAQLAETGVPAGPYAAIAAAMIAAGAGLLQVRRRRAAQEDA
ncbi:MAG: hypothetical protein BGO38_07825 [Cellulomonas sp. 73-145]|uniref:hypothetical protein n=1 Tax=Cellulomonas sp. 73-145 TaxID=1895739 RepID=UPI00092B3FD9|nr:hypothetical protein [Cellulomonas sp. 73-145]MBN9327638.1 hypothetical protein [Cellulomonas sp.]OJV58100.1 MAG: hypothetical protein BGO38_07825 [Cellulomonas sp. 73-145]